MVKSLVPELDGINEGTGGNILMCKIPDKRKGLKIKYSSENFPIIGWKNGHSREHEYLSGVFIFPALEPEGFLNIIVKQTKYTNPERLAYGRIVSVPKTSNSNSLLKLYLSILFIK